MRPLCRGEDGNLRSFRELASSSKASHSTRAALAAGAIDCGHCWPVGALMGRFDLGRLCDPRPRLVAARLKKAPPSPATIASPHSPRNQPPALRIRYSATAAPNRHTGMPEPCCAMVGGATVGVCTFGMEHEPCS